MSAKTRPAALCAASEPVRSRGCGPPAGSRGAVCASALSCAWVELRGAFCCCATMATKGRSLVPASKLSSREGRGQWLGGGSWWETPQEVRDASELWSLWNSVFWLFSGWKTYLHFTLRKREGSALGRVQNNAGRVRCLSQRVSLIAVYSLKREKNAQVKLIMSLGLVPLGGDS